MDATERAAILATIDLDNLPHVQLIGHDSNAFAIMGSVTREGRRKGWTKDQVQAVREEMMAGDYDHLLRTAMTYSTDDDGDVDWEDD